jgi:hypothetical protein
MPTPTTLTPAEYEALKIDAMLDQTAAIRENTAAMVASRAAATAISEAISAKTVDSVTEAFMLDVLRLVLKQPTP